MISLPFLARRPRRQATRTEPHWYERLDWQAIGASAAVAATCIVVALLLVFALDRPVRRVLLEGPFQRVAPPEIETAVAQAARGGLASVDLERIRQRVEAIAWVDNAVVTRVWPDAVRVVVSEQVAAARWNDTGLLNARGELFIRNARYVPPELPLLEGPDGSEADVAQLYIDAQGRLLEAGLRLTGVRLDERGAWELRLGDGLQVRLGRQAVHERLERFIRLASPMVAKRVAEISYVDMRYTNGFSVGWNARNALAVGPQEDATPDA
ncbi:MAG TPA: cell division protein FtsQ/DivIB [Steroidobacteraceae bacterium]|nr:cell division protein FtsQ/DivIB [Steroidobacteraceae bacterium]